MKYDTRYSRPGQGLCTRCGKPLDRSGKYCKACCAYNRKRKRAIKAQLAKEGRCTTCGKPNDTPGFLNCSACRARNLAAQHRSRERALAEEWLKEEADASTEGALFRRVLDAAKRMHEWIFLNVPDEEQVYKECGISQDINALLGSLGRAEIRVKDGGEP